eukprot:478171-Amphidinium_carterae.5
MVLVVCVCDALKGRSARKEGPASSGGEPSADDPVGLFFLKAHEYERVRKKPIVKRATRRAVVCATTGSPDKYRYAAASLCNLIRSFCFERCCVQCGPEPSMQGLIASGVDCVDAAIGRSTSVASKGPNGQDLQPS